MGMVRPLRLATRLAVVLGLAGCGPEAPPAAVAEDAATSEVAPAVPEDLADEGPVPAVVVDVEPTLAPEPEFDPEEVARARAETEARARLETERAAFEASYPLHGVAYHFLARVHEEPRVDSRVIGYMRRGSRFRASERRRGVGCARGWYEVPGDGFVCRGQGYTLGREPQTFEPAPVPAALDDALPYAYAWAPRGDVAQYWRLPTADEESGYRAAIDRMDAERVLRTEAAEAAEAAAAAPALIETTEPETEAGEAVERAPATEEAVAAASTEAGVEAPAPPGSVVDAHAEEEAPTPVAIEAEAAEAAEAAEVAAAIAVAANPTELPAFVRLRMRRGFYVSVDGEERDGSRRFFRTVRGAYVRAESLSPNEPPTHRGVVLGGTWQLPVAFAYRGGARRLRRNPSDGVLREAGVVERHTPMIVTEELVRRQRTYIVAADGSIVRTSALRIARPVERPRGVQEDDRWIHVSLPEQVLVAYEGDQPVFATAVSTGRETFETPEGLFRVQSKHVSTTMDDLTSEDEAYLIEDVPWTMYFEGNFALHGAFWHSSFGRVRSHGCVNLAPADARWLFQWSTPNLPASWHGVFATRRAPGTFVYVTGAD